MRTIDVVDQSHLMAICVILADLDSHSGIVRILLDIGVSDTAPSESKKNRLYEALMEKQKADGNGMCVCKYIQAAMTPVRFLGNRIGFEMCRDELNQVLLFLGCSISEDGKLRQGTVAKTLSEAENRASRLRTQLQNRQVHGDVLRVCQARYLQKDYFYAVFEAAKSVAVKIRQKSGLVSDGVVLVEEVFKIPRNCYPLLAFNSLKSDSEVSEHKGLTNLMKGLFGVFRNPMAHQPEDTWPISEQDALDYLTLVSLIHRRLDTVVPTNI